MQTAAILATSLLVATSLSAQAKPSAAVPATLPATAPTQAVSNLPSAHLAAAPRYNTRVTWDGSRLTIESNGEPMPEVLGEVAHETGMKITGGVPDEHLFGKYGPGPVQAVLGQLFDGLAINMLLVNGSATKPKELVLTARTGGPTPPSTREIAAAWQPRRTPEPIAPVAAPPSPPAQANPDQQPTATTTQPAFPTLSAPPTVNNSFSNVGNADSTPPATSDTSNSSSTQPQSPNGVKTPEQIFDELRKRAAAANGTQ